MPKGEGHPYQALARAIQADQRARAVFVLIAEGEFGTNWALEAPGNVAAQIPELLVDVAEDVRAGMVSHDSNQVIFIPEVFHERKFAIAAEKACKLANAQYAFVYVLDGRDGTDFGLFAPPGYDVGIIAELLRGIAYDIAQEEPRERLDQGLETEQ